MEAKKRQLTLKEFEGIQMRLFGVGECNGDRKKLGMAMEVLREWGWQWKSKDVVDNRERMMGNGHSYRRKIGKEIDIEGG